ncbi:proton channel OtopLc-like [Panonychus citri]|uniref:proton channel OtopLc-like n=1 Tax=Panonychus citri TaxID=50023 RepID=UPI0023081A45|nr:proton channel OtopLc-like [Panonychus citri]
MPSYPNEDEVQPCTQGKYVVLVCMVILVSFGIKLQSWTAQNDIYHNVFIVSLSTVGIFWLLFIWTDLYLIADRLNHSLDNPSDVTHKEWTYYTYLKAPHSYCFYLKVGLTIFCAIHLISTTTLLTQEVYYCSHGSNCFDGLRLVSSIVDLISSLVQLIFIQNHSNIIVNRHKNVASFGCMVLIAVALLKWFTTIAVEADFFPQDDQSELGPISHKLSPLFHHRDKFYQNCPTENIYNINFAKVLPYIDPFTIEFNFLLAIQWLIIWQHIGHYRETRASDYWTITEAHEINDEIDELTESIGFHKSGRGLFAGLFCAIGSLISLVYYFSAVGNPNLFASISIFIIWEDLLYLTSSLLSLLIASIQLSGLGKSTENCVGSTDMMLLFFPLIAFCIRGYIRNLDVYSVELGPIDHTVEILGVIQPLLQAIFIYFASSKICDTNYLSQHKPGRQIITLLIALNLVLWTSGAFRAKAKFQKDDQAHIAQTIFLDICQPFILFYRYHSSVCLANIWKIVYSQT